MVPTGEFLLPLGKADLVLKGTQMKFPFLLFFIGNDVTLVTWGSMVYTLERAAARARVQDGIKCDLIDLRTILPWDAETIIQSVSRTGRLLIAHEAPRTGGFGAEIAATLQERCLYDLKCPIVRVSGWDTPAVPHVFEPFYIPDELRCYEAIVKMTR